MDIVGSGISAVFYRNCQIKYLAVSNILGGNGVNHNIRLHELPWSTVSMDWTQYDIGCCKASTQLSKPL